MDNDFKPSLIDKEQAAFFRERWQAVYQIEQEEKKRLLLSNDGSNSIISLQVRGTARRELPQTNTPLGSALHLWRLNSFNKFKTSKKIGQI